MPVVGDLREVPIYIWQLSGNDIALAGTVSIASGSTQVTGTNTWFLTQIAPGDTITINGESRIVASIASNTSLQVTTAFTTSATGVIATRSFDYLLEMMGNDLAWSRSFGSSGGRVAQALCTGVGTMIYRIDGPAPPRTATLQWHCRPDGTENERLQGLLACYTLGGPYTLVAPTGRTFNILFDRTSEWREVRLPNGGYQVQVTVREQG